jgi:hypothetical protein
MNSSKNQFKNAIDKAYTTQPNVKMNSTTIGDALKYKSSFTEEIDNEGNKYETFLTKRVKDSSKIKEEKLKGGLSDNKTIEDIAKKHNNMVSSLKKELKIIINFSFIY